MSFLQNEPNSYLCVYLLRAREICVRLRDRGIAFRLPPRRREEAQSSAATAAISSAAEDPPAHSLIPHPSLQAAARATRFC
jgi:hypothetical protein